MKKFLSIVAASYLSIQEVNSLKKIKKQVNAVSGDAVSGDVIAIGERAKIVPQIHDQKLVKCEITPGCEAVKRGFSQGQCFNEKKGECVSTKESHKEAKSGKKWFCSDKKAKHSIDHLDKKHHDGHDYCDQADNKHDFCEENSGYCNDKKNACKDHEDICVDKSKLRNKGYGYGDCYPDDYCNDCDYNDRCYGDRDHHQGCDGDHSFCDEEYHDDFAECDDEDFLYSDKPEEKTVSTPAAEEKSLNGGVVPNLSKSGEAFTDFSIANNG